MEKRINAFPDLGFDPDDERDYYKTIAVVTFAFQNADAISWLMKRGDYIKK